MSLLKLSSIGKIYVSENNVTVGIRDVNLSFEKGEFVAVTGKSGSGKSTLLNVISGMDSYEEGELFIENQPTSHYLQPDWEEYRKEYISFIFQDYNIIESFTVLENVELALMHIEDKKARRRRATELIELVGLSSHLKHKGSKLSGGQKQRTVIARALAKDSPIILADEPTGNLDSATSKEIIDLLRRVSKDKLVIVVTHNYDDFSHCATRHIRIHDGAVEFDHIMKETHPAEETPLEKNHLETKKGKKDRKKELADTVKNGISLGGSIFKSKPKLAIFLCLLMIIGTLGIFGVTALTGDTAQVFEPSYMFSHIEGRLVITHQSGRLLTEEEIANLATKYGAEGHIRVDYMLDDGYNIPISIPSVNSYDGYKYVSFSFRYAKDFGENIIGRYPEKSNEVFLYIPIYLKGEFGTDEILLDEIVINNMPLKVVGVKYFYDNNKEAECLFTEEGFRIATAANYLVNGSGSVNVILSYDTDGEPDELIKLYQIIPSFDIAPDKVYIDSGRYETVVNTEKNFTTSATLNVSYYRYTNVGYGSSEATNFSRKFNSSEIIHEKPYIPDVMYSNDGLVISDEAMCDIVYSVLDQSYTQASLFFESDEKAAEVAELLKEEGFVAVLSNTTYKNTAEEALLGVLEAVMNVVVWFLTVVFMAFFINLCSVRAVETFKGDMAIMRSMGIGARVIKVGIYVRMLLCLIPAFAILIASAILIYTSEFNMYFKYLYFWQYALIVLGMIILTVRTTRKQIFRLFSKSVKKSLKGGSEQ